MSTEADIVERLSNRIHDSHMDTERLLDDAQDEITRLRAERDAAARDMRERCAKVAEAKREVFLSPQYAAGQPMSSAGERFACTQIADEIRALPDTPSVIATEGDSHE